MQVETERPCGFKIDHQPEFRGPHDRQVGQFGTAKNFADMGTHLPKPIGAASTADQAAGPANSRVS